MLDKLFADNAVTAHALDAASLRQQVIANNIANVNTPGYKRQEVQFESELARAVAHPNSCSTPPGEVKPSIVTVDGTSMRADGNNVDMETEMTNLATNQLSFSVLAQYVGGVFSDLKSVITGSGH